MYRLVYVLFGILIGLIVAMIWRCIIVGAEADRKEEEVWMNENDDKK